MTCALAVFSVASRPLIHLFLSDAYLPTASIIQVYMIGDVLRVWPSLAMHTAFADGQPLRYAGIEAGALTVVAVVAAALTAAGDPAAPPDRLCRRLRPRGGGGQRGLPVPARARRDCQDPDDFACEV